MDRAHRIGQKRTVNVYRLITKDTLEEKIMRYQEIKIDTSNTIISSQNQSLRSMQTDQLMDLLNCDQFTNKSDLIKKTTSATAKSTRKKAKLCSDVDTDSKLVNPVDLPEIWDQSQYDDAFDLSAFMKNVQQ